MQLTTDQLTARELLSRVLGWASGGAAEYVLTLDDAETAELAAAVPQRPGEAETVRRNVKAIVARANERRGADEGRAGIPLATAAAARNGARELLHLHLGLSADEAAVHEAKLTPEQRESLGELALQRRFSMANFQSDPVPSATVRKIAGAEPLPAPATAAAVDSAGGTDTQPAELASEVPLVAADHAEMGTAAAAVDATRNTLPTADDAPRSPDEPEPVQGVVDSPSGET